MPWLTSIRRAACCCLPFYRLRPHHVCLYLVEIALNARDQGKPTYIVQNPNSMSQKSAPKCTHSSTCYRPSRHANAAGFNRLGPAQRSAATKPNGPHQKIKTNSPLDDIERTFPAPLILPGDDLAGDPEYPPQSFQEWLDEEDRNPVTARRKTVYVLHPPQIDEAVEFLRSWSKPHGRHIATPTPPPDYQHVQDYVAAFYCGLSIKSLPQSSLRFIEWEEDSKKINKKGKDSRNPQYVGLQINEECVRIRTRPSPDKVYLGQLNLDDLLDAAISILPKDAYALMLLVNQDLYEDDEDTFVCGRAYGGSRVGVVSSARYNPDLDEAQAVERVHAWPASHCAQYIIDTCAESQPKSKRQKKAKSTGSELSCLSDSMSSSPADPMDAAMSAYRAFSFSKLSPETLTTLWLGRICRTASHELGHCFGIDHCVYYACSMQGTGSLSEDARQPPYLCPIDLAKLLCATSSTESKRDHALLSFCERPGIQGSLFFEPYAAWIRTKLANEQRAIEVIEID